MKISWKNYSHVVSCKLFFVFLIMEFYFIAFILLTCNFYVFWDEEEIVDEETIKLIIYIYKSQRSYFYRIFYNQLYPAHRVTMFKQYRSFQQYFNKQSTGYWKIKILEDKAIYARKQEKRRIKIKQSKKKC